jgi:starch synthase
VNTVSHGYLEELRYNANGLESLFNYERGKCFGILNGIDNEVWNPQTDHYLDVKYGTHDFKEGKSKNKKDLCMKFNLDENKPLIIFIGRLVGEKAADLLPAVIGDSIHYMEGRMNFLVLGSGEWYIEDQLSKMHNHLFGYFNSQIGYNELLSHRMYAGADFLLMPSRVEPCGLNQMYALRYGTVPMVRSVGGLIDTVKDFGDYQGFGIRFDRPTVGDITYSVGRAIDLYYHKKNLLSWMQQYMMGIDHSWEASAKEYVQLYESLK